MIDESEQSAKCGMLNVLIIQGPFRTRFQRQAAEENRKVLFTECKIKYITGLKNYWPQMIVPVKEAEN